MAVGRLKFHAAPADAVDPVAVEAFKWALQMVELGADVVGVGGWEYAAEDYAALCGNLAELGEVIAAGGLGAKKQ